MITKEIDVWIEKLLVDGHSPHGEVVIANEFNGEINDFLRGKVVIEMPEPKIEITPSEIKKAVGSMWGPYSNISVFCKNLNRELFGEDYDK